MSVRILYQHFSTLAFYEINVVFAPPPKAKLWLGDEASGSALAQELGDRGHC
jgi:hypothetical protein